MDREREAAISLPHLNKPAPSFKALTTHGVRALTDFRDRWIILFSHPGSFNPVCTTEFVALARQSAEFEKRSVQLVALSADSVASNIAWIRSIEESFGVKITFPIISDAGFQVASSYGMVHVGASSTETVRCLFVIDDRGILRAMMYYPMEVGRNVGEIMRLVDALQACDRAKVATPANWRPGDKVIVTPPATAASAEERLREDYECVDWYLCLRNL